MPNFNKTALYFNGQTDYADLGMPVDLGLTNSSFTIEVWVMVKSYDSGTDQAILVAGELTKNKGLHLLIRKRKAYFGFYANDTNGGITLETNQWYHLAFCYDLSAKRQSIFVNGFLDGSSEGHVPFSGTGMTRLACEWNRQWRFNGFIRDLRIWNRSLTVDDIHANMFRQLQGNESGLAHYWRLDEGRGLRIRNIGENYNPGSINEPTWSREHTPTILQNRAFLDFNAGRKSFISTEFRSPKTKKLTIEYWFRGSNLQSAVTLSDGSKFIISGVDGKHVILNEENGVLIGGAATDGQWHHIAMVRKGGKTNNFVSYLDGKIVDKRSLSFSLQQGYLPDKLQLLIGSSNGSSHFMNGQLAEVRIWNDALTPAAILHSMSKTLMGTESGLMVYYKLNEGAGGVAHDYTDFGKHGTIVNARWKTDEQALPFDLVKVANFTEKQYIEVKNHERLMITGDQCIEMWIRPRALKARRSIWYKSYTGEGAIILEEDGSLNYYYGNTGGNANTEFYDSIISSFKLAINDWSHIAITRDMKNKQLTWYLNGAIMNTKAISKVRTVKAVDAPLYIGTGYAENFIGQMAELRLWNRSLDPAAVAKHMNKGLSGSEEGLVHYLKMQEGSGAQVYDATKNNLTGVFESSNWMASGLPVPVLSSKVLTFNSQTNVILPGYAIKTSKQTSICFWFYNADSSFVNNILFESFSGERGVMKVYSENNVVTFQSASKPVNKIAEKVVLREVTNQWAHWAFVRDAEAGMLQVYLNGKLFVRGTSLSTAMPKITTIVLGNKFDTEKLSGRMAQVQIWDKALSAIEVMKTKNILLQGNESGLTGYYPLDSGEGAIARDALFNLPVNSINTLLGGTWKRVVVPQTTDAIRVSVAEFEGKGEAVEVPKEFSFVIKNAITIEAWAMISSDTEGSTTQYPLVSKYGNSEGFELLFNAQSISFRLVLDGKLKTLKFEHKLVPHRWYHIAAVFEPPAMVLYINGLRRSSSNVTGEKITAFLGGLNIGRNPKWTDRSFKGWIGEVRLWNRGRTADQIKTFMFTELPEEKQPGLAAYWKLDESYGSVAHDSSGNEFHGRLNYVYRTSKTLPIQNRKTFDENDRKNNIKDLWLVREQLDNCKKLIADIQKTTLQQLTVLRDRLNLSEAEKDAIVANQDQVMADLRAELEKTHDEEIAVKEAKIQELINNSTSISKLIENANNEITSARSQLTNSDYQLGHVSMEFKMIPTAGGDIIQFPTKDEWAELNIGADQLSTLELKFSPKDTTIDPERLERNIPDVREMTEIMARRKIVNAGFLIDLKYQAVSAESERRLVNRVVRQLPAPFKEVTEIVDGNPQTTLEATKVPINSTIIVFLGKEARVKRSDEIQIED